MPKSIFIYISFLAVIILGVIALFLGSEIIPPGDLLSGMNEENKYRFILLELRLPRVLTAILAGTALAISGLLMQSFFRNPLAGPYILGVSAGSGLGVALLIMLGSVMGWELSQIQNGALIFSVIGAAAVLMIVMLLSRKIGNGGMLLITGLMVGSFASAIISVLQFFAPSEHIRKYLLWTMGDLSSVELSEMPVFVAVILVFSAMAFINSKGLNAMLLGDESAVNLGVEVGRLKMLIIIISGVLAGVVTAYCGPVAFVGLTAPHIAKLVAKTSNHHLLIPLSGLFGALLLLICDAIAQMPGLDLILPINAVTSLVGAPLVISIIFRYRKSWMNG